MILGFDIKIEPSPFGQFKELLEPSSLGQFNEPSSLGQFKEPSPAQTVTSKDTTNPFMGEVFPKSLLVQLTQQVAEILKKMYAKKQSQKAQDLLKAQEKKIRMFE